MKNTETTLSVSFIDIVGSTNLYDQHGDAFAANLINASLQRMSEIVVASGGRVIKTIGDELMCCFPSAAAAIACTGEILQHTDLNAAKVSLPEQALLPVRIGLHWGEVLVQQDGDLLGDTVNVAARIASFAKIDEVILSEEFIAEVPAELRYHIRFLGEKHIRGKGGFCKIYQYIYPKESDEGETILQGVKHATRLAKNALSLTTVDNHYLLDSEQPSILLGRGVDAELPTPDPEASRRHAKIELRGNYFWISDSSANGTVVLSSSGERFTLRREELRLSGEGVIIIGQSFKISYRLETERK